MRARILATAAVSIALPAAVLVPIALFSETTAVAQPHGGDAGAAPSARGSASARPLDPNNITNISPYMQLIVEGNAKFLSGDYAAAITTYRSAIQQNTRNPLGYYLLGEALQAAGNIPEAEERWKQADANAGPADPTLKARILFVLAALKERQKKWADAKAAWNAYNEWAARFADAGPDAGVYVFPASAAARIKAIDDMLQLDQKVETVRRRIKEAAETDGGLFTTLDAQPG